ncbi:hypothetical protein C8024_16555 [Sphingopyxis sp. BSNA05]|nr:hypothetical protein [Sphingopyxis sp. BSNA05]
MFPITTLGIGPPYIWSSLPKFGQGMMFGEYVGILGKKASAKIAKMAQIWSSRTGTNLAKTKSS